MKKNFLLTFFLFLLFQAVPAAAVNWLTLIGTEPEDATYNLWGLAQPMYSYDTGEKLKGLKGMGAAENGGYVVKNTVGPWFEEQKKFQILRLRGGVRGRFWGSLKNSFTEKFNYALTVAAGENFTTYEPFDDDRQRDISLADCSLTYSLGRDVRLQGGLFKNPGPEEIFRPMAVSNYIQVSDFIGRVYMEFFSTGSTRRRDYGGLNRDIGTPVTRAYGYSLARDWGLQLFGSHRRSAWDFSWAVKLGRGEGIYESSDTDDNLELYLYSSLEYYLPGGQGFNRNGIKFFGWCQDGKRSFASDPMDREYDRLRYGVGVAAMGNFFGCHWKQRFGVELLFAEGTIFTAPSVNVKGGFLQYAGDRDNESRAITIDYGLYLRKWQFDLRYHFNDMLYKTDNRVWIRGDARTMEETTLGITYHFTPKVRMTANYVFRDAEAPEVDSRNSGIIVSSVKNRAGLQLSWIF